jgi:hypothetical protein
MKIDIQRQVIVPRFLQLSGLCRCSSFKSNDDFSPFHIPIADHDHWFEVQFEEGSENKEVVPSPHNLHWTE